MKTWEQKKVAEYREVATEHNDASAQLNLGICYRDGCGVEKDEKEAVRWFRRAANQNDADAQFVLGACYQEGQGVKKDIEEAVKYYRKAAGQGHVNAQYNLGMCYFDGRGIEKNRKRAVKWYRKAAEQGDAEAQNSLGRCYLYGHGVVKDEKEAMTWFQKAIILYRKRAAQDNSQAQCELGECYYSGQGVNKDKKQAVIWYLKAASQNNPQAQFNLADCYYYGQGVDRDEKKAIELYRKAVAQGFIKAKIGLGWCYLNGKGVKKDEKHAFKLFQEAAVLNDERALNALGYCYLHGKGVEKNEKQAVELYGKAAAQDYLEAEVFLGWCYLKGEGVQKDEKHALELFRKAAAQNDDDAQHALGWCYLHGRGVEKDEKQAIEWYRKAVEQENADAQVELGWCYLKGEGVQKNEKQAVGWFRKAAARNDDDAEYALGYCFLRGEGVGKDEKQAVEWYRKAVEQENADAQVDLGWCYLKGEGVQKNEKHALELFHKAAAQDNEDAQNAIGICCYYGQGIDEDKIKAVEWFQRAAKQDDAAAENNLGYCYLNGEGVERDEKIALQLFYKAAVKNDADAQENLGECYEQGCGVNKDKEIALWWYKKASTQGDEDAQKAVQRLETEGVKEKADKLAKEISTSKNNLQVRPSLLRSRSKDVLTRHESSFKALGSSKQKINTEAKQEKNENLINSQPNSQQSPPLKTDGTKEEKKEETAPRRKIPRKSEKRKENPSDSSANKKDSESHPELKQKEEVQKKQRLEVPVQEKDSSPIITDSKMADVERTRNNLDILSNTSFSQSTTLQISQQSVNKKEKRESIKQDSVGMPKLTVTIKESKSGLMVGKAVKNGDCYFDSLAQALLDVPHVSAQTIKSLRQICHKYAAQSTDSQFKNWFQTELDSYEDYKSLVQYTFEELKRERKETRIIWGDGIRDGQIACQALNITIHTIEVKDNGAIEHGLITPSGIGDPKVNPINYADPKIIHLALYKGHFVPLLSKVRYEELYKSPHVIDTKSSNMPEIQSNQKRPNYSVHDPMDEKSISPMLRANTEPVGLKESKYDTKQTNDIETHKKAVLSAEITVPLQSSRPHDDSKNTENLDRAKPRQVTLVEKQFVPAAQPNTLNYSKVRFFKPDLQEQKQPVKHSSTKHHAPQPVEKQTQLTDKAKCEIGKWGEDCVYQRLKYHYEKKYAAKAVETDNGFILEGVDNQNAKITIRVKWYNKKEESYRNRDMKIIKSKDGVTTKRYIEVKTTTSNEEHVAIFPQNEWQAMMQYGERYSIFRVFNAGQTDNIRIEKIHNPLQKIMEGNLGVKSIHLKI